ncbi:MSHA biogenesis protein MshO precursor [Shewanella denitrificans OS217]|uniref:MSHA biogenesis protein MshO n=1 Tax=Shewanella denitrificans (strain OS217 / ATCC BAA-1090 / DSM 15013) TaxID=318161 RepID=Q12IW3_SHEDO|nr:type II secretion system protein [Shewanella denitrificans]ABE56613.1 MSHA biogenesis protein MshO precursor [Shewanella denitrificans OS217]
MRSRTTGFTLVELVTVILILGVMVIGVSGFIIFGTRIFVESSSVDQVLGQSRYAIERMTRELRGAVPNSVRLSNNDNWQCLEFVPIEASTSYLTMPIAPDTPAANTGTVIIDDPDNSQISAGQWALIYPLTDTEVYDVSEAKRFQLASVAVLADALTLGFATQVRFEQASPRQRVYFASQAVSYCFEQLVAGVPGDLYRYSAYGLQQTQPNPNTMPVTRVRSLMGQNIINELSINADLPLSLTPSSLMTNAIVQLQPRFRVLGETFQYRHQVQVINVP